MVLEAVERSPNCFVTPTPELMLEGARAAVVASVRGNDPGLVHGLPVSVKDLIAVGGVRMTFGISPLGCLPSPASATHPVPSGSSPI
jgi:Asp-tRNA(Asn)/Glu-tRNA(Gln) amidotransferase A subunit family amidase